MSSALLPVALALASLRGDGRGQMGTVAPPPTGPGQWTRRSWDSRKSDENLGSVNT